MRNVKVGLLSWGKTLAAMSVVAGTCGCGLLDDGEVPCTLLGCYSHFDIEVENESSFSGTLTIRYADNDVDGKPASVKEKSWSIKCPDESPWVRCKGGRLYLECAYNADCDKEYSINTQIIPTSVSMTVSSSDSLRKWSGTWVPVVHNRYPNGKRCDKWPCQTISKTISLH